MRSILTGCLIQLICSSFSSIKLIEENGGHIEWIEENELDLSKVQFISNILNFANTVELKCQLCILNGNQLWVEGFGGLKFATYF